ncbi:hypothetical protein [uncultured Paraglaciecola sp.]|uniref:hypothetical protein n=1 Tax=uncultured Paraglaciecola sp. TaxID=1765024 RepID=UPI00261A252F|nr:hypothetical protein [uncultured Paraglaciecola sp.]
MPEIINIALPCWAPSIATGEAFLEGWGLASTDGGGNRVYHRDLRGLGSGYAGDKGWMILPDKSSGVKYEDVDGEQVAVGYNSNLPGVYCNLEAIDRRSPSGTYSLANTLTQVMDENGPVLDDDGNPTWYDLYETVQDVDGNDVRQLKNVAYRTRIYWMVLGSGGESIPTKGFTGDPKAPKHLAAKDTDGNVIFRVFDPDDVNTPANTTA